MTDFPTMENVASNLDESINSIYVIHTTNDDAPPDIPTDNPTAYAQLDQKYNDLKWKYDECLKDNLLLKNQCDYLTTKLVDLRKTQTVETNSDYAVFENNDSILAYVDVDNICISNKIEHYFQEANIMFKEKEDLFDSIEFLIKNVWSLIAHKYSLNTLETSQLNKEQLIEKLNNAKKASIEEKQKTQELQELFSLNDELTSYASNTDTIKEKIMKQNMTIKQLIRQMEGLKSNEQNIARTSSEAFEIVKEDNQEVSSVTDDDSFSPGSSPSSFFMNRFKKNLKIKTTAPIKQPDLVKKDSKLTHNAQQMSNDFYIFNHGEYIAIDKTLESSNAMIRSQTDEELNSENVGNMFICENCKVNVNSSKVSKRVAIEHEKKDCLEKLICMFCMELFDKRDQEEFEAHVRSHISLSINDT